LLGNEAAAAVQTIVEHARHPSTAGPAALLSAVLLAFGASATFASLNTALNRSSPIQGSHRAGANPRVSRHPRFRSPSC
jgi:membrane protein